MAISLRLNEDESALIKAYAAEKSFCFRAYS